MKLYKFRTLSTNSLSALANNKLWFSRLNDFNDPFEGAHILNSKVSDDDLVLFSKSINWKSKEEVGEEAYNKILSSMKINDDGLSKITLLKCIAKHDLNILVEIIHNSKIACFSLYDEKNDLLKENLMWSHYANGLRGFCLVFDGSKLQSDIYESSNKSMRPIQIKYQDEPKLLILSDYIRSIITPEFEDHDYIRTITETIATKSVKWKYENEVRISVLGKINLHLYSYETLLEIVIGSRMPKDQKNLVIGIAKKSNPNIIIKEACLKHNSYQIEILDYK